MSLQQVDVPPERRMKPKPRQKGRFDPEGTEKDPGSSPSASDRGSKRSKVSLKSKNSKSTTNQSWRRKGSVNTPPSGATSKGSPTRSSHTRSSKAKIEVGTPPSSSHRSGKKRGSRGGRSQKSDSKRSKPSRGSRSSRRSRGSKKSQKLGIPSNKQRGKKTTIVEGESQTGKNQSKPNDRFLRRVFLDKLTADITESDIREEFGKFGELEEVARFRHKSNPSMYYAFVVYETAQACFSATKNPKPSIHGHTFDCYLAAIGEKYSGHKFFKEMKPKMRKKPYGGHQGSMHRSKGMGRGGGRGVSDSRMGGMRGSHLDSTVGMAGNPLFYHDGGGFSDGSMQGGRMMSHLAGSGGSYGSSLSVAATAGSAMTRSQSCQSLKHGYPSASELHRIDSRSSMHSVDSVRSGGYMSPRDYSPMYTADRRTGMVPPVRLPRSGSGPILGEMRSHRYGPSAMDGRVAGMAPGHHSYYPMHTVHSAEYVPSAVAGSSSSIHRPPPAFQPGGGAHHSPVMQPPHYQQSPPKMSPQQGYPPAYPAGGPPTRYRTGSHPTQVTRVHTADYMPRQSHSFYGTEGRPTPGYGSDPPLYVSTVSEPRSIPTAPGVLRYPYPPPIETQMPIPTMPPPGQSPDPDLYTEVPSSDDESLLNQLERFGLDEHYDDKALIDLSL